MRQVFFTALLLVFGCHVGPREVTSAVPGYLDFDNLPDTNFSCEGKVIGGYYADVETGCQMFHVCTIGQKGEITDIKFLCLNGTVFDQETRVCERVDEVDCSKTEGFYGLNLELYGNTGATYGLEEPEEAEEDPEEAQSHHNPSHSSSSSPAPTSPSPATTLSPTTQPPTPTTTEPPPPPPPTPPVRLLTPPTTVSSVSTTLHSFNQKTHAVHYSTTSSPHSVSSSFLTFPSRGQQLFESGDLDSPSSPPPPSSPSSSSSWPQVKLQNGGGSGIIHQTDTSPFHSLKTTPKPPNLFGAGGNSNSHTHHQFLYSTTKAPPSHFFSAKSPSGFSVTSHPLKNPGLLLQTNLPSDFYHDQPARNRPQQQKTSQSFGGHHQNVRLLPNPTHFQYSGRPSHQHQVFTTPSVQSTVVSSTSSVSSVKTTIKHNDNHQNPPNPPANVNTFAFGINSGLSPSTYSDDKHNETKEIPTPPSSYDEYHERDVALDPFFKDVPRISLKQTRAKRRRRQTEEILRETRRGSQRFRNDPSTQRSIQPDPSPSSPTNRRNLNRPSSTRRVAIPSPRDLDASLAPPAPAVHRRVSVRRRPANSNRDSLLQESQVRRTKQNDLRHNPSVAPAAEILTTTDVSTTTTTTRLPLPETSFSCSNKVVGGYYADPEVDCQLFHICVLGRHGKIRDDKFLCGPGTRFDQKSRTCQVKHLVNCSLATSLYHVNLPFYFPQDQEPVPDDMFESHKISKRAVQKGVRPIHYTDDDTSLDEPPQTDFSCLDKKEEGLYSDVKTGCKFFHLCQKSKNRLHLVSTFMCPSGTLFNQPEGNCDTSTEVDCELYSLPEHSFSKSRARNRRQVVDKTTGQLLKYLTYRYERAIKEESTEVYYDYYESNESEEYTGEKNLSQKEDYNPVKGDEGSDDLRSSQQVLSENTKHQNKEDGTQVRREGEHFKEELEGSTLDNRDESLHYTHVKSTTPVSRYLQASKQLNDKLSNSQELQDEEVVEVMSTEDLEEEKEMSEPHISRGRDDNPLPPKDGNEKEAAENGQNHNPANLVDNIHPANQANVKEQSQEEKEMINVLPKPQHSNSKENSEVINSYSQQNNNSEETLELKVNELLKKLNASVDDVSSVDINSTTFDYYDYYTDDETLSQLERFKEKIISVHDNPQVLQNETVSSPKEQFAGRGSSYEESTSFDVEITTNYKSLPSILEKDRDYLSSTTEEYQSTSLYQTFSSEKSLSLTTGTVNEETVKNLDERMIEVLSILPPVSSSDIPELDADLSIAEESDEMAGSKENNTITSQSRINIDDIDQKPDSESDTTTDILPTLIADTQTTIAPSAVLPLLHPFKSRPIYRTWKTTTPPPPISIRPSSTLLLPPSTTPTSTPIPVSIRPGGSLRIPPKTTPSTAPPPVSIRPSSSLRLPPQPISTIAPPQVSIRPSRLPKPSTRQGQESSATRDNSERKTVTNLPKGTNGQNKESREFPQAPHFQESFENLNQSTDANLYEMKEQLSPVRVKNPVTSPPEFNEDKSPNPSSLESYKTVDYNAMTPSSVLPTFSRKSFAIDEIHQERTEVYLTSTISSTTVSQTKVNLVPSDVVTENVQHIASLVKDASEQQSPPDKKFTCMGKSLNVYLPDPTDCYRFHYCSLGFHSRQLLDFRFLCDKGTAFSSLTHRCESEDEVLCGVLS